MKVNHKPVRKCHDCGLNLGDRCALFDVPRERWNHRPCLGYKNEEMLRQYLEQQVKRPANPRKESRRALARLRATEPHYQGNSPVVAVR
jgi:hypothetical protein